VTNATWRFLDTARAAIERQRWLDPVSDGLQAGVESFFRQMGDRGQRTANFLHGTWLAHPLHPVLTVLPLGSWTGSVILDFLDLVGMRRARGGADLLITSGLLSSTVTAAAGLTDWHKTDQVARRYGLVHALLNSATMSLFFVSWVQRKRGHRGAARFSSLAGIIIGSGSAYLGGDMVYRQRLGVNHAPVDFGPPDWTDLAPLESIPQGVSRHEIGGEPAVVIREGDDVAVLSDRCAHMGGPLSEGTVRDGVIECPWHGSRYLLADGHPVTGPTAYAQPCLAVRRLGSHVQVRRNDSRQD
jgi:nitrite reductase/ring-hydroxylating ferredoxin subunit/uncharacterized membrane protein